MTKQTELAVEASQKRQTVSSIVLGVGFGLTGAGTVMLGVLLPLLSQAWGLRDDTAGFLFFLQFLGSSAGALLTGTNRIRSLVGGYGLLVVMAGALAFAGPRMAFPIFLFFGLGLGMAMTSTSLLFSDRYGQGRAAMLERLNFGWSAGATAAPLLFMPFLHRASLRPLFFTFQGLFLLMLLWVILRERHVGIETPRALGVEEGAGISFLGSLLPLVILSVCAVGVEGSLSGWLTTYSHRAGQVGLGGAAIATAAFWGGIMLSRLAFSTRLLEVMGRRRVLYLTLCGVAASVALLVAANNSTVIRLAAALAGVCVGPLYPLLLSYLLERTARGWIFAVAGLGSAIFPWLTGMLSAHFGSLRYGLIAPCFAALLMIVLLAVSLRPGRSLAQV
jgi:MFS transporter, FHS family, glucose/mannose:H+ symporter